MTERAPAPLATSASAPPTTGASGTAGDADFDNPPLVWTEPFTVRA